MSNCIPCPPCEGDEPLICEPYGTVTTGNRVMVEDDAFCTKTIANPSAKATLTWDNGVKWELAPSPIEFVQKSGDTMTGLLFLSSDPTANLGAATKQYADTKVSKSGDTMTGALVVNSTIASNSTILANGNSSKIGYDTGAGGAITQGAGAKTNSVTLNRPTGIIVTDNAALASATAVTFNLSNSVIEATDIVVVSHISGGTLGSYNFATAPAAGNANIVIRNITAGSLSEALTLRFIVIKSVNA
jgi:hypothetical protein